MITIYDRFNKTYFLDLIELYFNKYLENWKKYSNTKNYFRILYNDLIKDKYTRIIQFEIKLSDFWITK